MRRVLLLAVCMAVPLSTAALAGAPARGGGGKGGDEEAEPGTVYVLEDHDKVILRDGTEIEGTVLCAGQAAVTLLTPEGERTIPREKIERVIKNTDGSFPRKFVAEEADGHKYLTEAPPEGEGGEDTGVPGAAAAPPAKGPRRPKASPTGKRPAKGTPKTRPGRPARGTPRARPATPKLPDLPKLPGGVPNLKNMPKDPAKLRALLQRLQKEGKLQDLIKDPRAAEALRRAMKKK
jgi:hypothetical protein